MLDSTVVFNELYYHPSNDEPSEHEWIELHNQMSVKMDISGWTLGEGVRFTFPEGTIVPGRGHLVVASNPAALVQATGYDQVLGPVVGRLSNGGERLTLLNKNGRRMSILEYGDESPWPVGPDGSGFSLAKAEENTATDLAANWTVSAQRHGTPGSSNFPVVEPIEEQLVTGNATASYLVPTDGSLDKGWTTASFDDSVWTRVPTGLGFDVGENTEFAAPPDTGLRFWLDASDLDADGISNNPTVGSEVSLWRDKILGLEFEPIDTAPQLTTLGPHGAHSVQFFGGDLLQELDGLNADFLSDSRGSITMVFTNENGRGENHLQGSGFLAGRARNFVGTIVLDNDQAKAGFAIRTQGNGSDLVAGVPPSVNDGQTHWSTITADGTQWQFFTDSAGPLTTAIDLGENTGEWFDLNPSYEELTLGGFIHTNREPRGREWVGNIAEVLIYDHVLSETERTGLDEYVKAKYFDFSVSPLVATDVQAQMRDVNSSLYVRSEFEVAAPSEIEALLLDIAYDDGFLAYLNGQEVARRNAPVTTNWNSAADGTPDAQFAEETIDISSSAEALVAGENVVAIHGLNASPDDSDFLILPELTAIRLPTDGDAVPPVVINEVAPAGTEDFWFELTNQSEEDINLASLSVEIDGRDWPLDGSAIAPGGYAVIAPNGASVSDGDRLILYTRNKNHLLDATRVANRLRGRSDRHDDQWLYPASATPGATNRFEFNGDIVINEIMYHAAPHLAIPDTPPTYSRNTLVSFDSSWRYNATGADLGASWAEQTYAVDNSNWLMGQGAIGFVRTPLSVPIRTELTQPSENDPRFETYYFQTEFDVSQELLDADTIFQLRHMIDDAAAFYLNGTEVVRFNMPEGEITATTRAARRIGEAELSLPINIDVQTLRAGTNVLSAELHLRSSFSRSFFFATKLTHGEELTPLIPGRPFSENDDEWIELYNRGSETVDLTGWTLRDAVEFDFPAGTEIAPDQYVAIAKDVATFAAAHPDVRVLGNFSRSLSNSNERILLRDATDNPADAVHYYDGGRWPKLADGRGSSLELRDPDADNSIAETWGASDESDRSEWNTYTIRRRAQADTGPLQWNEFVFGMLRDGQVLVDDLSVKHLALVPQGDDVQLIQNGDFEADTIGEEPDKWRIVGNHHGTVVIDPLDRENQVLFLDATGPTHHEHNNASTTFVDNTQISNVQEYEISFRAKWLSGGSQLLSRFYVNRVAATTIIETPLYNGTPGRPNSRSVPNVGPTYADLSHSPVVPLPFQDVAVSIVANDPDGVSSLALWWSVDGGPFSSVPMAREGGEYRGTVPGQAAGTIVQFYVESQDAHGANSTFPAAGADGRALFQVEDGQGTTNPIDNIRIIMLSEDISRIFASTEVMSNEFEGATVIVNNRDVFYDVDVHPKGSSRGRPNPNRWGSYTIRFHPDHPFRGVHDKIGLDKSGGPSERPHEMMVDQVRGHAAGGVLSSYTDLAYSIAPVSEHIGPLIVELARYDSVFLDERFENGGDATVFEHSLIYYPTNTDDDTPEGLKPAEPNGVIGVPPGNYGDDKEFYRWNNLIKNNRARDDYDSVIAMNKVFSLTGDAFLEAVDDVIDIDQWLRTFALGVLISARDSYLLIDWQHNTGLIVRPSDGRVLLLPWDSDNVFRERGVSSNNPQLKDFLEYPEYKHMYYGHLHDILSTTFNSTYLAPWAQHYGSLVDEDWSFIPEFADTQAERVADLFESNAPPVDFAVTTQEPHDAGQASMVTLAGDAWINVREIQLANSDQPFEVTWTDVTAWQVNVPVAPGTTDLTFQAYDFQGELVGTDTITVTSGSVAGDLTGDGLVNVQDIDLLNTQVQAMSGDSAFDLDGDGLVNQADTDMLVGLIGTNYGDTNLDGSVDAIDFETLAGNFGRNVFGWSAGDYNGDGRVAFNDFVSLSTNFEKKLGRQQSVMS